MHRKNLVFGLILFGFSAGSGNAQFDTAQPDDRPRDRQSVRDHFSGQDHRRHGPMAMRRHMLEEFDANGDGQLDETERATAKEAIRTRHKQRREMFKARLLERFDANGDGELDETERAEAKQAMRDHGPRHFGRHGHRPPPELVKQFDENADGRLDDNERAALRAHLEQKKAELIERFDTNGNGQLEGEEREAVRAFMRAEHQKRRLDLNHDGVINELDAQAAMNRIGSGETIPDYNHDGKHNAEDGAELLRLIQEQSYN